MIKMKSLLDPDFQFSLEDLDCKLCLYYGGMDQKVPICLAEKCCCLEEREAAKRRKRRRGGEFLGSIQNRKESKLHCNE